MNKLSDVYCDSEASEMLIINKYQEYLIRFQEETRETTFNIINQYPQVRALEMMARVNALIKEKVLQNKYE
jgi:hypothetical protein